MSFRPDGYCLIWEALSHIEDPSGEDASAFPMLDAATKLLGPEWYDARHRESEKYPGVAILFKHDGSNGFVLNAVLSHWVFINLLGGDYLPIYFCSPLGHIIRSFSFEKALVPLSQRPFWAMFNPVEASLEDFVEAFLSIKSESFTLLDDAGLIRPPAPNISWRLMFSRKKGPDYISPQEYTPFVGWSVCLPGKDRLPSGSKMLSVLLNSLEFEKNESRGFDPLRRGSSSDQQGKPRSGRPSLHPEILTNFRMHYVDGLKNRSVSEVARVLGYDRKTTRKALLAGGILSAPTKTEQ